jgi:hypothetical protein
MKVFLASILEPDNFGPGRVIGVYYGDKPKNLNIDYLFEPFTPSCDLLDSYYEMVNKDPEQAGSYFVSKYQEQLDLCYSDLVSLSKSSNDNIVDLLPFNDGDTLVSWERSYNTHYRGQLAEFMVKLGFEVVSK